MKIGRIHSWKKVITQILLLVLPTIFLVGYLVFNANDYFSILQNSSFEQTLYFTIGIVSATVFYAYRLRFLSTLAVLLLFFILAYNFMGKINSGEFDTFFYSIKFLIFTYLFTAGWIAGYGFSRSRFFTIFFSILLLSLQVLVVSKTTEISAGKLITAFAPVLFYSFFLIYTAELIRNLNEDNKGFIWYLIKRTGVFVLFSLSLIAVILLIFQQEFKGIEKDWAGKEGGSNNGKEGMTKENKDGSISNNDQMKMTGSLSKDKRLVFVAKLDNYFPDGKTPNPLYFTNLYYTKFDTLTQTFETDSTLPKNDLFSPDPSRIPLYFTKTDTSVISNSMGTLNRKIISADIYKVILSPNEYVAPSTSFFCQPLPVENDYKNLFKSAYRAKMWVSNLNSAYFIYNPAGNKQLENFQQLRFDQLRNAGSYEGVDKSFMSYYTFMPRNEEYNRITLLAQSITKNASTTVDKMIAIRDYFTGKDEFGQPLFKYSDNPGIPGMPSASKLNYFLFENRKGYCAYYAGATLFMLRSLGIPSRIAAGFLTIDRSSKNPGWYWFYADQAHAWVQLFFPGYGWIDFDTTVPDQNTQQSPQPDGTPPMNTQQAFMVADGNAVSIDTISKTVVMKVSKMLFHDENIIIKNPENILLDVSIASITKDTGVGKLNDIKPGTSIVAVSYAESLKNIFINEQDNLTSLIKRIPNPTPVDEIKIMETDDQKQQKKQISSGESKSIDWVNILRTFLFIIVAGLLVLFSLPWFIWQYLNYKAKNDTHLKSQLYHINNALFFLLHHLGEKRQDESPEQFSRRLDSKMGTHLHTFMVIYQKIKYSNLNLTQNEIEFIKQFYQNAVKKITLHFPLKTRLFGFLQFSRTFQYFEYTKKNK